MGKGFSKQPIFQEIIPKHECDYIKLKSLGPEEEASEEKPFRTG